MDNWADYVGYLASAFVVGSFLLKKITTIRTINLLGCICFVIYGIYSGLLWPIIIPNAVLAFIQLYHIIKKD
ncbi:MAG: uroporphyrinogen decarboxylase [Chryseobacterium sp.]|nr:MAG: uroporphyrinogen decarboxylase [Chryseobacterium sp.]